MSFKRPESVLVVIYDEDKNVLIMQRNDDAEFWQSVTGTLEHSELPFQTAKREVLEETGIDVDKMQLQLLDCRRVNQYEIRPMWRHKYPADTLYNTEYVFVLKVPVDCAVTLTEHSAYKWVHKAAAIKSVWSASNREAIVDFVPEPADE